MPRRSILAHYEQLSEFERGRIIGLKEGGWENWRIARDMGRIDTAIRRCCLSNTSLSSQITKSLSNRACLGYDWKAIASTRECYLPGPTIGANFVRNAAETIRVLYHSKLRRVVACIQARADETWLYYYDPAIKQQSSEWKHQSSPTLKKAKTGKSAGKVMTINFFIMEELCINYQYYRK
ncbi:hypothetical protein TNCV_1884791 [Trichonephila clavipes]|nr:hypothetical protein TNCV_1884791 [Trichonephila clavipes]